MATENIRITPAWLAGFVDRAASFFVIIEPKDSYQLGRRIRPEFRLVQPASERAILVAVMEFFEYGHIRVNKSGQLEYRVRNMDELEDLVNFFLKHPLSTKQQKDVLCFQKILTLLREKEHLTEAQFARIVRIAEPIMRPAKRGIRS